MNSLAILALQRLSETGMCGDDILAESTDSICCDGSTKSCRDCCNTWEQ